jgi:hypothetical protein
MSMTPIETAICDLRDAGLSHKQIVQQGFTASVVHFTLSVFGSQSAYEKEDRRFQRRMVAGSNALLSAIQKATA